MKNELRPDDDVVEPNDAVWTEKKKTVLTWLTIAKERSVLFVFTSFFYDHSLSTHNVAEVAQENDSLWPSNGSNQRS